MIKLKNIVDGSDHFYGAHGIVKARTYKRNVPEWVASSRKIRAIISAAFPKHASDDNQRTSAARWASVIHLYFKMGYTETQIAHEMGSTSTKIHGVIRSILRVSRGLRADGTQKRGGRRGRPKKAALEQT